MFPNMIKSGQDISRVNEALQSWLQFLEQTRSEQRSLVVTYREYAEGTQTARLNSHQLALFPDGKDPDHVVNVCPIIVTTIADRLKITGFNIKSQDGAEQKELTQILQTWWDASVMDAQSSQAHSSAGRDGDTYFITDFDNENQRPRWTLNQQDDGQTGCDMAYNEGTKKPEYATKRWIETDPLEPTSQWMRLNIYFPNRVEKYISSIGDASSAGALQPFTGDAENNPAADSENPHIEWLTDTGTESGVPLGIPVIHFPANTDGANFGRSDLADVVPALQDQLNDASVDLRIATKFAGVNVRWAAGVKEGTTLPNFPGAVMTATDPNTKFGEMSASDLGQLIASKDSVYRDISTVTGVPLANINPTAQVAAEGTLQQQEAPLLAKVEKRQTVFGNRYEQAIRMALKFGAVYGSEPSLSLEAIDDLVIAVNWKPAQLRNELIDAQRASLWRDNGVPEEIIWQYVLMMPADLIETAKKLKEEARQQQLESQMAQSTNAANNDLARMGQTALSAATIAQARANAQANGGMMKDLLGASGNGNPNPV